MSFPRTTLEAGITMLGIIAGVVIVVFTVQVFQPAPNTAQTIGAVMSPAIGAITTLVGFVAGHAAGAASGQQAATTSQEQAASADKQLKAVLDTADPGLMTKAMAAHPDAFK